MNVGIMQPYFLPYIGYWQLINAVDIYVIYDDVNYIKRGWINRNNILVNDEPYLFTLSLSKASQNKLINEIEIEGDQTKLIKTFQSVYKKAPFFNDVSGILEQIFDYRDMNLARFVGNSILIIADYLGLKTAFMYSSEINKDNSLKGQDKIIEICKILKTTDYYNAIGGTMLYNQSDFEASGIQLHFMKSQSIAYKQFNNLFVPYLSILDIMMFNSAEQIKTILL